MLFTTGQDLTITVLRADELENLDENNDVFTLDPGAGIGALNQYVASDQSEQLNGVWGLQFDQDELAAAPLTDAWLVVKYQLEIGAG